MVIVIPMEVFPWVIFIEFFLKNQNLNFLKGMSAEIMTIEDYQSLINRGWRRSKIQFLCFL